MRGCVSMSGRGVVYAQLRLARWWVVVGARGLVGCLLFLEHFDASCLDAVWYTELSLTALFWFAIGCFLHCSFPQIFNVARNPSRKRSGAVT